MASEPAAALPPEVQARFEAWIAAAAAREPLTFPELRRGVQALSARYVERRGERGKAAPTSFGAGLRAAFASFYAPLHFLAAYAAAQALPGAWRAEVARVVDLGAGTGAVGAALSLATTRVPVLALDRSGWALGEARRSFAALGVPGRTRRAELPGGMPAARAGDLFAAGFALNELEPAAREQMLARLGEAAGRGARVLVLEPLAHGAAPWWDAATARLAPLGFSSALMKWPLERPAWIARLDEASGLDHRTLGARVLWAPHA